LSVSFGADVPNQGRVTTTLILGRVRVGTPYNLAAPTPSVNLPSSSSGAPPTASPVTALPAPVSAPVVASPPPAPTAGAVAAPPVQPSAVVHPLLSHGTIRVYAAMVIGAAALVLAALLMRRRRRDSRTATSVLRLPQS
jgi:hypothetical protein